MKKSLFVVVVVILSLALAGQAFSQVYAPTANNKGSIGKAGKSFLSGYINNLYGAGTGEQYGYLKNLIIIPDTDSTYTLTAAESGSVVKNLLTTTTVTLPAVAEGLEFFFIVGSDSLAINPYSTNRILGLTNANGDSITNATTGGGIHLISDGSYWYSVGSYGTWSDAN